MKKDILIDGHAHIGFAHKKFDLYIKDIEQMIVIMNRFGIQKAVVSSLKAIQYDFELGNLELKKEIKKYANRFIPLAVVHPRHIDKAEKELRKCINHWGFKGLKLHPSDQGFPADCYSTKILLSVVEELGIPVFIHSSQDDLSSPYRIANLAKEFRDITFIMCHMGQYMLWFDTIEIAMQYENVILDTTDSMFVDGLVETAVRYVGADRVIWGTNLPLSYPGPNIERIKIARISDLEKEKIFARNIQRILKIN